MVGQTDLSTIGATEPPHGNVDRVDWNCESHCHNILDLGDVLRRHSHIEPVLNRRDDGSLSLKDKIQFLSLFKNYENQPPCGSGIEPPS